MPRARQQTRAADEAGFTIIEVLVAALLVGVALVAVLGSLDAVGKTARVAQRHQQGLAYGQREMERLRTMDYVTELGMTSLPTGTGDGIVAGDASPDTPKNPNFYVSGTALKIMANYANKNSGLQAGVVVNPEPFVGPGETGLSDPQVVAGPESFTVNGTTGNIYRYVTWRAESCPAATTSGISNPCTGTKQSKRITIAVVVDAVGDGSGPAKPIWISSIVNDPSATPTGVAPPSSPATSTTSAQSFFLTDTRCTSSTRQAITASHATHGTSATATPNCTTAATAADFLDLETNPDDPLVGVFDYSNELTRSPPVGLSQQAGLALTRASTGVTDCPLSGAGANVHTWASAPMPTGGFAIPPGGRASLVFSTQTLDGSAGRVTLCATLRNGQTGAVIGSTGLYDVADWPTVPSRVQFAWDVTTTTAATIPANQRLLLTVALKASTSTKDALLLYDHPSYQSFVSVATTTPLG